MKLKATNTVIYLYFFSVLVGELFLSQVRYLMYLIPLLPITLYLFRSGFKIESNFDRIILQLVLILIYAFFVSFALNIYDENSILRALKELLFVCLPILFAIPMRKYIRVENFDKIMIQLFVFFNIFYLVNNYNFILSTISNIGTFFVSSKSELESTYALVYGVFPVYFYAIKKRKFLFLSVPLVLFGSKRIAIIASLSAILLSFIIDQLRFKNKAIKFIALIFNILVVYILYLLATGDLNVLIKNLIGVHPDYLTMGRATTWEFILRNMDINFLFGNGIGSTSTFLQFGIIQDSNFGLIHSDLLKLTIEFGVIAGSLYIISLYRLVDLSRVVLPILIYMNVLYITGNSLIYVHVNILVFLIISRLIKANENLSRIAS